MNTTLKPLSNRLTEDAIRERLCLNTPDLINRVLSHSLYFYESSLSASKLVDEKVNMFFSFAGVAFTVLFGALAIVFDSDVKIHWSFSIVCIIAFLLLAIASAFLLAAMQARKDYRVFSENDLLNCEILNTCESKKDSSSYDRYLSAHFIDIALVNNEIAHKKGDMLIIGQKIFYLGLLFLLISSVYMSILIIT